MPFHSKQTGNSAIHPAAYVGTSDPASPDPAVTADNKLWIDTTTGTTFPTGWKLKLRGTSNSAWATILDLLALVTQSIGDNSTKPATTAYADRAVAKQPEVLIIAIGDETTVITTGAAKVTFRMPFAMTVTAVRASLTTVSSSGLPTFNVKESGTTIFSTNLTIDASEKTSTTAATPVVISDTSLADDAEMTIDVVTAGTGATGAKIYLIGTRT